MSSNSLFDAQFVVTAIDPDGKKFDRGALLAAYVLTQCRALLQTRRRSI